MKIKEIKDKDDAGLKLNLVEQQKHLFVLRTQSVTEKLEDPTQLGKTRKTIARIKTVLHQRTLATEASATDASPTEASATAASATEASATKA